MRSGYHPQRRGQVRYPVLLPLAEFERMIADPAHCRLFATMSIEHLDEALSIIGYLMANDPTVRVAGRLLTLAEAQAIPEGSAMRLTQSDHGADVRGVTADREQGSDRP